MGAGARITQKSRDWGQFTAARRGTRVKAPVLKAPFVIPARCRRRVLVVITKANRCNEMRVDRVWRRIGTQWKVDGEVSLKVGSSELRLGVEERVGGILKM